MPYKLCTKAAIKEQTNNETGKILKEKVKKYEKDFTQKQAKVFVENFICQTHIIPYYCLLKLKQIIRRRSNFSGSKKN